MGENRGGWEWREGAEHVGGEDIAEVADCTGPGLEVCEGAVTGLSISLDKAVDVEGIYVVKESAIL